MDGLNLIEQAHAVGLEIHRDGERIVIRGPKDAEQTVRLILENKAAVIENYCYACGLFIDRTGKKWALVHHHPIHLNCYSLEHLTAGPVT